MEARIIEGATNLQVMVDRGRIINWAFPSVGVLIMAGGPPRDWAPLGLRQLLSVDGETLIDRLVRQVRHLWQVEPVIVTDKRNKPFGFDYRYAILEHKTPAATLDNSDRYWGDTTFVLQGDVYYSDVALALIDHKDFFAYGRGAELYALKFTHDRWDMVRAATAKAAKHQIGRLWHVYRAYDGIPIDEHKFGPSFYKFSDADSPVDFDQFKHYDAFIRERTRRN